MSKTIKAQIISNNIINADITSDANINANIKGSSNLNAYVNTYTSATTTKKGIIRIATDEEAIDGISENTAITPHTLKLVTNYVHEQAIASETWVINHNLNKYPSITLTYTSGEVFLANTEYTSLNQVIVHLDSASTGYAYLN